MTIGSLFSGIGGLELGLEWAGLGPVSWQVESDARCRRVLARHWPGASRVVEDVRHAGRRTLSPVRLVCGGFPCQDVSGAGRGAGLDGSRSGLWWEFHRVVSELRPSIVVVENVASGARRWVCAVRGALHGIGYRTRALGVRASDVGAPHRRSRIFVVAYADGDGVRLQPGRVCREDGAEETEPRGRGEGVADAASERREGRGRSGRVHAGRSGPALADPPQPGVGGGPDGVPGGVDRPPRRWPAGQGESQHAWEPPREAPGVTDRPARLRALGAAVVPQCSYLVGLAVRDDVEGAHLEATSGPESWRSW